VPFDPVPAREEVSSNGSLRQKHTPPGLTSQGPLLSRGTAGRAPNYVPAFSFRHTFDPKASLSAALTAALVLGLIFFGSGQLRHFDWLLLPYALATVFSAAAIVYRYVVWLQRPPTQRYWQQGWRLFWQGGTLRGSMQVFRLLLNNFAAQRFIAQRSRLRWITHLCLSWGGMLAFAVTFPLVFGWIHFETLPEDLRTYRLFVLGVPAQKFAVDSLVAFFTFNALNFSAVLVLVGTILALHRRLTEPGALALQQFTNDVLPLLLLLAVAITGLGLTVSTVWLKGQGSAFIALIHATTVITLLSYLPFGKLFHIFQRPAHLGVALYKQAAQAGPQAHCARCQEPFASQMQVEDLMQVLGELGFAYSLDGPVPHYQHVCPACRRKVLAVAQGRTLLAYPTSHTGCHSESQSDEESHHRAIVS